ncbi:hypothetical protein PanWU01x14_128330 [Parasponia andersonii]|uniref:Uncharacterized protein n=1 Tax=Parasponia andersonii TaxID=3476 RepID=A0A2P5CS97_PARAD|nr:hypothetical protein PanWU01x14_128330 [Parasponia andersonii]
MWYKANHDKTVSSPGLAYSQRSYELQLDSSFPRCRPVRNSCATSAQEIDSKELAWNNEEAKTDQGEKSSKPIGNVKDVWFKSQDPQFTFTMEKVKTHNLEMIDHSSPISARVEVQSNTIVTQ